MPVYRPDFLARAPSRILQALFSKRWRAEGLLFTAALAYYGAYVARFPYGFGDEGYLHYVAFAIQEGRVPLQDIQLYNYLPGLFYAFAGVFEVFGPDILAARMIMMAGLAVTPVLLYRIALRFVDRRLAFALAVVVLLVPGPWDKFYVGLLGLALLHAMLMLYDRPGRRSGWIYGALLGLAFIVRIDTAFAGLFLLAAAMLLRQWLWPDRTGRLSGIFAPALVAAVLITLPMHGLLAHQGILEASYLQIFDFVKGVLPSVAASEKLSPPSLGYLFKFSRQGSTAQLFYLSFVPLILLALCTAFQVRSAIGNPSARPSAAILVLVLVWSLTNVPQYALERPDPHHLTQRTTYIALVSGLAADRSVRWLRDHFRAPAAGVVVASLFAFYLLGFALKHSAFAEGGTGLRYIQRSMVTWKRLSNGVTYPARFGDGTHDIVTYVLANTEGTDRVAAYPFFPGVNFLSQRLMPGRHVYVIPERTRPSVETRVISDLRAERVPLILYLPGQNIHGKVGARPINFMGRIHAYIERYYRPVLVRGAVTLYSRRATP